MPPELIKELKMLSDSVEPVPFIEIKPIIERQIGPLENSFIYLNERAFAAASISQAKKTVFDLSDMVQGVVEIPRNINEATRLSTGTFTLRLTHGDIDKIERRVDLRKRDTYSLQRTQNSLEFFFCYHQ